MDYIDSLKSSTKINQSNAYEKQVWVHSCIKAIAMNISRVPFRLYSGEGENRREIISGPAYELLKNPNPIETQSDMLEGIEIWKQAVWM